MRLLLLLLVVGLPIESFRRTDESGEIYKGNDYSSEYEDDPFNEKQKKKSLDDHVAKKIIQELKDEKDGEPDQDKSKKKSGQNGPILICDGSKTEACTCELHEVNCVNIQFDDDGLLDTLDVALADTENLKGFEPYIARFADNVITKLRRNRMPEGMESSLSALYLERNKIATIEARAFDGFTNISKIALSSNRLNTIRSDMFAGAIENTLHQLDLSDNRIVETEKSPFRRLKNLKKLVLDGNRIAFTKDFFEGLDNLQTLSMDDCRLDDNSLPKGIFEPLKKLKSLSLRLNAFTEVPEALDEVKHLLQLDLSETSIAEIHRGSFSDEQELTTVYLENCPYLVSVQDCAFCGLNKLKFLSFFNSSRLAQIDANAFGFKEYSEDRTLGLIELKLSKTNITTLDIDMLEYETLEKLELDKVPLNCTCDLMHLRKIQFPSGFETNARCAYPKDMRNKYLDQVTQKEMCGSRYARGYRFFFALFGVISASILCTIGYILFNKGYRFTNIRNIPMPTLPGANSAYTNLSRQEDTELADIGNAPTPSADGTPDFHPRPQMV